MSNCQNCRPPSLQYPRSVAFTPETMITVTQNSAPFKIALPPGVIGLNPNGTSELFTVGVVDQGGKTVHTYEAQFYLAGSFTSNVDPTTSQPIFRTTYHGLGLGSTSLETVCVGGVFSGISNLTLINSNVAIPGFGTVELITATNLGLITTPAPPPAPR